MPISAKDVFQFRDEYIENRNLIGWNFYNPKDLSQQVNIVINYKLRANLTKKITVGTTPIKILNKSALIEMKQAAGRAQDLEDIAALERL